MTVKKALLRGIIGLPLGVFLGYTITIIISLFVGQGNYVAAVPALSDELGNVMTAVLVQYLFCAILGFAAAFSSAIFQIERWSITKQTIIHFVLLSGSLLPIAYLLRWMDHTIGGVLMYIGIFAGMYLVIWLVQIAFWKNRVKKINKKLRVE